MNFENEFNYAKLLISEDLSKDNRYYSKCVTLVRYWRTIGKTEQYINNELYNRLKLIYYDFGDNMINTEIHNILSIATSKGLLENKTIYFSKEELDYIHAFNDLRFEKFVFIMFCAYKISDDNKFTIKYRELMRMANISFNQKNCNTLINRCYDNNLFNMDSFHNVLKYYPTEQTLKLFNKNNIVLSLDNFKNLVYYYLRYINEGKYMICKNCGCIERLKSNNQLYCSDCSREMVKQYDRLRKKL